METKGTSHGSVLDARLARREFLFWAGSFGLSATGLALLASSCTKQDTGSLPETISPPVDISDSDKLTHLWRRAGFGASAGDIERCISMGYKSSVDYFVDYESVDNSSLDSRLESLALDLTRPSDLQRWWLTRMGYSKRPLEEKMTLFWHALLASEITKVSNAQLMLNQNNLYRKMALGKYGDLLKAVSRDPAMLIYLDSSSNKKEAPNENFARELMELFTLGVGNYTEDDVREAARAFTGWGLKRNQFEFNAAQHDNGTKHFLGRSGNFNGDDIIDIIMTQPKAAEFICTKLVTFFVNDRPASQFISELAGVFRSADQSIKSVMRYLFNSAEFTSETSYRVQVKSPVEFAINAIRGLGIETNASALLVPLNNMGQTLFDPPDVSGWPGGISWINSTTLLERFNLANSIAIATPKNFSYQAQGLLRQADTTDEQIVSRLAGILINDDLTQDQRQILVKYIGGLKTVNEKLSSLIYLLLASPEYQLS